MENKNLTITRSPYIRRASRHRSYSTHKKLIWNMRNMRNRSSYRRKSKRSDSKSIDRTLSRLLVEFSRISGYGRGFDSRFASNSISHQVDTPATEKKSRCPPFNCEYIPQQSSVYFLIIKAVYSTSTDQASMPYTDSSLVFKGLANLFAHTIDSLHNALGDSAN